MTIIEPAYPYIYMPQNMMDKLKQWSDLNDALPGVQYDGKVFLWNTPCDQVDKSAFGEFVFDFKVDSSAKLSLNLDDLLVPSEEIDTFNKSKCFLGIFKSGD